MRLADDNLYKAKDAGRNCVVPSYPLAEAETLDPVSRVICSALLLVEMIVATAVRGRVRCGNP